MLRNSGRIFFHTKKKEVNHGDTENTEAKQKNVAIQQRVAGDRLLLKKYEDSDHLRII
jgi:hypothetical protein